MTDAESFDEQLAYLREHSHGKDMTYIINVS